MERLWTPWRSAYVGGERTVEGSLFETLAADSNDEANLILLRGERCFVIMNLFPYNTGHVMVVPYRKVADPVDLTPDEWRELGELTARLTAALRATLGPDGFNIGMNVGTAAGAGIPDHLHLHIVPRWAGDTNFMPVLGATKVLPELVPETYARLRGALAAVGEQGSDADAAVAGVAATATAAAAAAASAPVEPVVDEAEPVAEAPTSPAIGVAAAAMAADEPSETTTEAPEETTPSPAPEPTAPAVPQAGAVVLLRDKVALRLTRDQTWVLPKGHIEPGETPEQAAVREVAEEMGLSGVLGQFIDELRFVQGKRERQVRYYLFRAERPLPSWGDHLGRDAFLFSPREALTRLTHDDARALLARGLTLAGMKA